MGCEGGILYGLNVLQLRPLCIDETRLDATDLAVACLGEARPHAHQCGASMEGLEHNSDRETKNKHGQGPIKRDCSYAVHHTSSVYAYSVAAPSTTKWCAVRIVFSTHVVYSDGKVCLCVFCDRPRSTHRVVRSVKC